MKKFYKRDLCKSLQTDSKELGWIKLTNFNLIELQQVFNELRRQRVQKLEIELKSRKALAEYENLMFVTKNNRPTQQFIVQEGIEACVRNIQKNILNLRNSHHIVFVTPLLQEQSKTECTSKASGVVNVQNGVKMV